MKGRKAKKRLERRQRAFDEHGTNPKAPQNPSNSSGTGHDMRRPGSLKK
jgi:hypothetical protein